MSWTVVLKPVSENPSARGKNDGGLAVILTDGSDEAEVSRVLFKRRNALRPKVSFRRALVDELKLAKESARALNQVNDEARAAEVAAASAERRALARPSGGLT